MTTVTLTLQPEYGYVILSGILSGIVLFYLGGRVGGVRKKLGVDLPSLYADRLEALKDKDKHLFNCYQRGHQNALESWPIILTMLFVGGIKHPVISAAAGVAWSLGRILYAFGYSTGDPSKRSRGAPFYFLAMITLLGTSVSVAYSLLQHKPLF